MPARKQGIVTLALMVPALGLFAPVQAQQFDVSGARSAIIAETNAYRAEKGLPALRENAGANRVAHAYAHYLARTDKTGHRADGRSSLAAAPRGRRQILQVPRRELASLVDQAEADVGQRGGGQGHGILEEIAGT